jgi:ankyrin repeat protein
MKILFLNLGLAVNALQGDNSDATQLLANSSRLGDYKTVEALLSSGVNPNLPDKSGRTPLYYSVLFNRNDIADLLLARDADPNLQTKRGMQNKEFPETPFKLPPRWATCAWLPCW